MNETNLLPFSDNDLSHIDSIGDLKKLNAYPAWAQDDFGVIPGVGGHDQRMKALEDGWIIQPYSFEDDDGVEYVVELNVAPPKEGLEGLNPDYANCNTRVLGFQKMEDKSHRRIMNRAESVAGTVQWLRDKPFLNNLENKWSQGEPLEENPMGSIDRLLQMLLEGKHSI